MGRNANLLYDLKSVLGEGPVWNHQKQLLFWVDIEGYKLHQHDPLTEKYKSWDFDEMIGAAVPTENGNLLLAMEKGLASFDLKTEQLTKLKVLENTDQQIRFNDGKVGPDGAFWVGTMDKNCAPGAGNLFRVDPTLEASLQLTGTSVSNGMAWTTDKRTFYYVDSPSFEIRAFDFDSSNGTISNGRTAVVIPKNDGSPDGMCIDSENMLWVAHWGGHCVRRWNPETGEVLDQIDVPAPHVTSCCFGKEDFKTLYITTARGGLSKQQLNDFPLSGGIFFLDLAIKGTPINYFKEFL